MKIGIDISSDKMCGILMHKDVVLATVTTPIGGRKRDSKKEIMDKMITTIDSLFTSLVKAIGISLPTKSHANKGVIYDLDKIPHWKNIKLKALIEKRYNVPTFIDGDVNCFMLAEKNYGACKDYSNILGVTMDATVGTAVFVNNKLFASTQPTFHNAKCLSQASYHCVHNFQQSYIRTLEEFTFIAKTFRKDLEDLSHHIWKDIKTVVARLVSIMLINFESEVILLGGKLSGLYHNYKDTIKDYIAIFSPSYVKADRPIIYSELENPRAIGAAYL